MTDLSAVWIIKIEKIIYKSFSQVFRVFFVLWCAGISYLTVILFHYNSSWTISSPQCNDFAPLGICRLVNWTSPDLRGCTDWMWPHSLSDTYRLGQGMSNCLTGLLWWSSAWGLSGNTGLSIWKGTSSYNQNPGSQIAWVSYLTRPPLLREAS